MAALALAILATPWAGSSAQTAPATPQAPQSRPADNSFTDRVASELLEQLASGLVAHNQTKVLGAFDLARMKDGARFRQQIVSFLAQAGTIRIHYNQLRTSTEGLRGAASAMVEMEVDSRDDTAVPRFRRAQLRLVAENTASGWRFTDVQPREFFSPQP